MSILRRQSLPLLRFLLKSNNRMKEILTNEQKLDEIYTILRRQESQRKRAIFYRVFKWIIIFSLFLFIATNPVFLVEKITTFLTPLIAENMKATLQDQKNGILEMMKDVVEPKDEAQY